ncbi:MarR family winged helix-turn-helix transcriptional regulator [Lactobacillus xylocopicola]|uniref:MarR family transcriptional regulator n=1 Tax=Lactobacillus xylocopicola TaxID=2976676 RepID=A0ABN6SN61_9LACO|nr:MarR family transcriptional regulator [Lactobacillus xylocopicola]BDR60492.1 MarR family transcriptional regulator [Lactobacillus xylocopicola]
MDILSFSTIAENIKKEISHRCGLNLSQTRILLYFQQNNNTALKMGDLATYLKISLSTLSRQLQQKKTMELVTITRSETDSSKTVALNQAGLKKVAELKKTLTEIEKTLFASSTDQEVTEFNRIFNILLNKTASQNHFKQ